MSMFGQIITICLTFYLRLSPIFYAEYGAYADREYMRLNHDWSRIIEGRMLYFVAYFLY